MSSGLWTAAAGATAQAQHVDVISNNLANADTLGFKKDMPTFKEYLATVERDHDGGDVPRTPIKDKDFYPLDGRDQAYVVVDGTYTNFRQGALRVTQAPLDVAMDGPGFLEVATPQGVRFTRQGNLKVGADGRLVTLEGYPVLSAQAGGLAARNPAGGSSAELIPIQPGQGGLGAQGGASAGLTNDAARFISLRDRGSHFSITKEGEIYAGNDLIAKLSVVEFQDQKKLHKLGGQLFENRDPANFGTAPQKTIVRQGVLETSNVNPIEEMTHLINANRMFEHDLKAMKTYDSLLQREANDIGKL